jgi:hypothetical protein
MTISAANTVLFVHALVNDTTRAKSETTRAAAEIKSGGEKRDMVCGTDLRRTM